VFTDSPVSTNEIQTLTQANTSNSPVASIIPTRVIDLAGSFSTLLDKCAHAMKKVEKLSFFQKPKSNVSLQSANSDMNLDLVRIRSGKIEYFLSSSDECALILVQDVEEAENTKHVVGNIEATKKGRASLQSKSTLASLIQRDRP
jgi:hypothetical protein